MKIPQGWSRWTHREKGGEYQFLTIAKGTGPDHGVDFAYYLGIEKTTGAHTAFVRRMDSWYEVMLPLDDAPEIDDFDLGDMDLDTPDLEF